MEREISILKIFSDILREKKLIIFIIGILMALLSSGVKWMFSDAKERVGDYSFVRMIQVQTAKSNDDFAYDGFLSSPTNYYQFIENTSNKDFDFTQIDSAWKRKNLYEQMNWLKEKIYINSFHGNVFEVVVHLDSNITPNVEYLNKHGNILADDFVKQSEHLIKQAIPDASFSVISEEQSVPQIVIKDQKNGFIKSGIIGFFMGIIGSIVIIFIYRLRQAINQK